MKNDSLSRFVDVVPRFRRAVSLRTAEEALSNLEGYVLSPLARDTTSRLLSRLASGQGGAAMAIVGPYGGGKSSLAAFWTALLGSETKDAALQLVASQWPDLEAQFLAARQELGAGVHVLPIAGQRASLRETLLDACAQACAELDTPVPDAGKLARRIADARKAAARGETVSDAEVRDIVIGLASAVRDSGHRTGLLLIIDEFGKLLEWAAEHPKSSDVYLLQLLAEASAHAAEARFGIVTILHQGFDSYARLLPRQLQEEWSKIEGRFERIPYLEAPAHLVELVARALRHEEGFEPTAAYRKVATLAEQMPTGSAAERAWSVERLARCAPLNPVVAVVAGPLFRLRLGQNERSLFAFLASAEPFGLQTYLRETSSDAPSTYALDTLFDYVLANTGVRWADEQGGRVFAAVEQTVARLPASATALDVAMLKAIALLGLVGTSAGLRADTATLATGLGVDVAEATSSLDNLTQASAIVFRQFANAFVLWDGSDVDLAAILRRAREEAAVATDLDRQLADLFELTALPAPRHAFRTGVFRLLEQSFVSTAQLVRDSGQLDTHLDGRCLLVLPGQAGFSKAEVRAAREASERVDGGKPTIVVLPAEADRLRQRVLDLVSIASALDTAEVAEDAVARRELRERIEQARDLLQEQMARSFGPGARCFSEGRERPGHQRLSEVASTAFDAVYDACPRILNELVNRAELSSAAAAARRVLMERMLTHRTEARLGIEGHPPELSMYLSVLDALELHVESDGAEWHFVDPGDGHVLAPAWAAIAGAIAANGQGRATVDTVIEALATPPFGIRQGVSPILILAYVLADERRTFVYEDGVFIPRLTDDVIYRMLRKPSSFELQQAGAAQALEEIRHRLTAELLPTHAESGSLLHIVRAILNTVKGLSPFATSTQSVSDTARRVRSAVLSARDPIKLLQKDLPQALRIEVDHPEQLTNGRLEAYSGGLRSALRELVAADDKLEAEIIDTIRHSLRASQDDVAMATELAGRARVLLEEAHLTPGVRRFATITAEVDSSSAEGRKQWASDIGTAVLGRPPSHWRDDDVSRFKARVQILCRRFRAAEDFAVAIGTHASAGQTAYRLAVMDGMGAEFADVALVGESQMAEVDNLYQTLLDALEDQPAHHGLRVAALARLVQHLTAQVQEEEPES